MSEEERDTLNELFALRREVKELRAQLEQQTPAPEPQADEKADQLRRAAEAMMGGASDLLKQADAIERGEPVAWVEPEEAPDPNDYRAVEWQAFDLFAESDELRTQAEQLHDQGVALKRRAESLRTGEPLEPVIPAHEEPLFETETLDPNGSLSNEAQRRRKVWFAIGYLVDAGFIQMPNLDPIHEVTKTKAIDHMRHIYFEIEDLLRLLAE